MCGDLFLVVDLVCGRRLVVVLGWGGGFVLLLLLLPLYFNFCSLFWDVCISLLQKHLLSGFSSMTTLFWRFYCCTY